MLHKTKGIVLRSVKYRDTSLVVTIFTEVFGLQTYLVNGARSAKIKTSKAAWLQPANILELVVYHQEQKKLQRLSECRFGYIYQTVHFTVVKNTIALFIIELLLHALKQPEEHTELYFLTEKILVTLDETENKVANLPLYFIIKTGALLGFEFSGSFTDHTPFLDLKEGNFTAHSPAHPYYLTKQLSEYTFKLMQLTQPAEAPNINMNHIIRRQLLTAYLDYFSLHLPDFTPLKSISILQEILE